MCLRAAPDVSSLTNFDVRTTVPRKSVPADSQRGREKLKQAVPGASADFDPLLHTPKWVQAGTGFLTGENGEGGGVSRDVAQKFARDPDKALKGFLDEQRELFRHGAEVLDTAKKKREHATKFLRTVAWEQQVDGIPVFDSVLVAHTTARGELISVASLFLPAPAAAAEKGTPGRAAKVRKPPVTVERALRIAAENLGEEITETSALEAAPAPQTRRQKFTLKPLPGEASAGLVWFPLDGDTLRLGWDVELNRRERSERFRFVLDAETGALLLRRKLTVDVSDVQYRVYTSDSPSPFSPGHVAPTNVQPPLVARQLLAISNVNVIASPLGWINDGVMETRGNNVDAHLDRDGDDRADLPRISGTTNELGQRVFDFPIDLGRHPTNYAAAAAVQLFYWCNWMHDRLYELGFTESVGNFQKDNFGRGGLDNDVMLAQAQDGSGFNNANFTPTADGSPGKIQMFIFNMTNPFRDGDLDAEVILHEYAHGLSDRLIGGGVGIAQLQTYGMGEGWSDFFAEALLSEYSDNLGGNYPLGGYVTYLFNGLTANYYYGIRRYPYTTNLNANPLTFKDIDPTRASTHPGIPRNPIITSSGPDVHRQGEVWCSMLWDLRAFLLAKYAPTNEVDFTNANNRVLRYVTLGLQLSPPNPNFLQARDSILQAVRLMQGGSDTNEVWRAFARRGLGLSALCPESATTVGVMEAYDTPAQPEFDIQPKSDISFSGTEGGPFLGTATNTTVLNTSPGNAGWAAGANVSWLQLAPVSGVLASGASIDCVASLTPLASTLPAGPYAGTVFFTNQSRTQVITRAVSLFIQQSNPPPPDPMVVSPTSLFSLEGPPGGPFKLAGGSGPPERVQHITNIGDQPFWWRAFTTNGWLRISPTNNLIDPLPDVHDATIQLTPAANALAEGTYLGAVTFVNSNSGVRIDVPVSLRIGRADFLTEQFLPGRFDLQNTTLTFTPDRSTNFYNVCRQPALQFLTDPLPGLPVTLADDAFHQVTLTNNRQVTIFGVSSSTLYIGANGHVTFNPVLDTNFFYPGLDNFFAATRVAPLYVDLNPAVGGTVSYQQLSNRFVVTYENVPEFGVANVNNAQIELFYDGALRLTWLRVEATNGQSIITGLSRGGGLPADFVQTDLSASETCGQGAVLLLPLSAMEGDGEQHGTILLSAPATNDLYITLTSSDPNEVIVPDFIIITPGQTSFQFGITVVDDGEPDGTQPVTVTAVFADRPPTYASMLVDDAQSSGVSLNVRSGGREGDILAAGGLVRSDLVAVRPLRVSLFSENTNRVRVPASVVIPAGQDSAPFDIVLLDDNLIQDTQSVIIVASVVNWNGDLDVIRVSDNESRALRLTLPLQVVEGQGTITNGATITLGGVAETNIVIALQSEISSLVAVPAFVTNAAGASNVSFTLIIGDNMVTNGFDRLRVSASATGFLSVTSSLNFVDDERPFEALNPSPAHLATDVARNVVLRWTVNSNAPTTTIYDVYLGTNAALPAETLMASTTNRAIVVSRELDPATTYYWQVVARLAPFPPVASAVWEFKTTPLEFQFDPIASPQFTGESFPISVRARDKYGLVVSNYAGSLTLTNFAPVKSSSTIAITEIETSNLRSVEFANVSDRSVNIAGWKVVYYDLQKWPAPTAVFTIPGPAMAAPGNLFVVRNLPPQFAPGTYPNFVLTTNILWSNNAEGNPVAVLLLDQMDNMVDFVCAFDAFPALISEPRVIPSSHWTGPPAPPNLEPPFTLQRVGNRDLNNSNDWRIARRSTSTNNVGFVAPFTNSSAVAFAGPSTLDTFVAGVCTAAVTVLEPARGLVFGVRENPPRPGAPEAASNPIDVFARNDISVTVSAPPSVLIGELISYEITITNSGPLAANDVTVSNILSANAIVTFISPSQGSCAVFDGTVVCDLGQVSPGEPATIFMGASASARGQVTNITTVSRSGADGYAGNNSALAVTSIAFPQLAILDATNGEPSGASTMFFNVRLSGAYSLTCSVAYATANGTATAGADYQSATGVLIFPPGSTNQIISITLNGDLISESNENFFVTLFNPTNVDVTRAVGTGTISDNDALSQVSVLDSTVAEGDTGTVNAVFNVRLDTPSGRIVTVRYATGNGSALAGFDYVETYGSIVFQPGMTNQTVMVPILGDTTPEPTKTFTLNLTSVGNAIAVRGVAVGTITDNDLSPLEQFTFDAVPGTNYIGALVPFTVTARDGSGAVATDFNQSVTLLASAAPRSVTIGTNATNWTLPLAASFHDTRVQSIYLSNEVAGAGRIVGLSLDVVTAPAQTLSNFTIRLRHTPLDRYLVNAWEGSNWVIVCQRDATIVRTGWTHFAFSTPFRYNGRENLMIDFSFDNSTFSSDGVCRSSVTPANRSLYLRTDSAYGRPTDWPLDGLASKPAGALNPRVPNVRLLVDTELPLSLVESNGFSEGVWAGAVRIVAGASNIVLRAVDPAGHFGESNPFATIPLRIDGVAQNGGEVSIRIATLAGSRYVVEAGSTANGPWAVVSPILNGTGGVIQFAHQPAATPQFYRVRLAP